MEYVGIKIYADGDRLAAVSDAMWSIGAEGVSLSDGTEMSDAGKWDYADEDVLVKKPTYAEFFVPKTECIAKVEQLKEYLLSIYGIAIKDDLMEISTPFSNEDWYNNWKQYYTELSAGKFNIVPVWLEPKHPESRFNILIDPGMAFGTGEHASTRLALRLMSELDFAGVSVADIGTGSGILGIAAAKCNPKDVYMCDIEEDAIKAAAENVALNFVNDKVSLEVADLVTNVTNGLFNIVLANLTADLLLLLLPAVNSMIASGGLVVASGIITARINEVLLGFSNMGFVAKTVLSEADWNAVLFQKA